MARGMGHEPMKPMTMRRRRFMGMKTPNDERRMTNDEQSGRVELLRDHGRIAGNDDIRGNALGHDGASGNDGVFAYGHAFEDDGVHADPDVIGDDDGSGAQRRAGRAVLEKRREGVSVDNTLSGRERMEIGGGDADVPRDKARRY